MLWFSAARRGLRCNPDRQTLPANDARKGTPRMRFRSQSDPGTRLTTLETGSPTQTWPHPAHLEGDDFTAYVLVLYTTFRWTGRSCTGHPRKFGFEIPSGKRFSGNRYERAIPQSEILYGFFFTIKNRPKKAKAGFF